MKNIMNIVFALMNVPLRSLFDYLFGKKMAFKKLLLPLFIYFPLMRLEGFVEQKMRKRSLHEHFFPL
jgi:hypothetical protein